MNASELIRDAYTKIGKRASQQGVKPDETATAISYLNDMMYAIDYIGLGFTEVTNGSDEITTPAYSWKWMKNKLALELAPEFGVLESYAAIERLMQEGWSTILISKSSIPAPTFPGTVPRGSGNKTPGNNENNYYTETDSGVLTETNQDVGVEDGT